VLEKLETSAATFVDEQDQHAGSGFHRERRAVSREMVPNQNLWKGQDINRWRDGAREAVRDELFPERSSGLQKVTRIRF
jgi:hypothetical protein